MSAALVRAAFAAALLIASQWAAAALPPNVEAVEGFRGVTQYRLKSNGMTLLAVPDRSRPVVTFMVVYHVGSRNESPGNTGSAHLLEHMLFNKSTENFGRAKGHRTVQEVLYEAGADFRSTNMTTWYDRMNGYSTLPSDKLELAMRVEADRMGRALILDSERQSEMSVVRNEFEIGENNPGQALQKAVIAASIQAHPYHWSTIGYRSDIEGVTTEKLREHYKAFFWPDNAEAIVVGDFDLDQALALFDRQFGSFPRAPHPVPKVITVEPPQEGERRVTVRRPGTLDLVMLAFPRPGAMHPDFMPLEVLSNVLTGGVNSRLYQALVESKIATDVGSDNYTLRDPFPLLVTATLAPGRAPAEAEAALKVALARVASEGVTPQEVARAQRQIEVSVVRSRDGTYNFASNLGEAVASADWKWFLTYVDRIRAVTPEDVKRVAATYLVPAHATVGWFVATKGKAAPAAPIVRTAVEASGAQPVTEAGAAATAMAALQSANATAAAPQSALPFAERTHRAMLPNLLVLDVVENHTVPTVSIRGLVRAGDGLAAQGEAAVPALVAKMLARGTRSRSKEKIAAELDDAGASRSYSSGVTALNVGADGLARDLPLIVGVLAEELREPRFAPEELYKARQELESDYARADDNTTERSLQRLRQAVFPPGHPYYAWSREEKSKSALSATVEALQRFHAAHFTGANTILSIVGDVDAAAVEKLVRDAFAAMPRGERAQFGEAATSSAQPVSEIVTLRGKANTNIMLGSASGLARRDADYEATLVANAVLGETALSSRLGKRVRDTEGLSYSLGSRFSFTDDLPGLWWVSVNVAPQNTARALASTREVIAQYAREGPTDAEVEVQKSFFAGNFKVGLGSNAGVASALSAAEYFGFGARYLDEYPSRIRAVTSAQVRDAMRKHLATDRMSVVVSGDLDTFPEPAIAR